MHRINALPAYLFIFALLISACGGSGEYDTAGTTEEEAPEEMTAEMGGPMEMAAMTIEGTLMVDTKCYGMNNANIGNDHMMPDGSTVPNCGTACAMMGIPVALVEGGQAGGKAHVLLASATALADHVAKEARVTGMVAFDSGFLPEKVEVMNEAGEWVDVTPGTMM